MSERRVPDTDPSPGGDDEPRAAGAGGRIQPVMARPPRPRSRDNPVIPPAPPLPRLESERPAVESSLSPPLPPPETRNGVGPFGLDPALASLVSQVISRAIADEMGRVRASLAPSTPATPAPASTPTPPSEPPRSSMRVVANKTGKGTRLVLMASGAVGVVGQIIIWIARPEVSGPLWQALKLLAWVVQSIVAIAHGGTPPPPPAPDAAP